MTLPRSIRAALLAYLWLMLAFLFAPIIVTIVFSFSLDRFATLPWRGFTLMWYERLFTNPDMLNALKNSVIVGIAVGAISVVLGFTGAYGLRNWTANRKNVFMLAMISPLAVPWMLLGLGILIFLNNIGLSRSLTSVCIGHTVFAAPLAMMVIDARLSTLSRSPEEAAWDLGADRIRAVWYVVIPQTLPALISAFLLTFTLSFDEFIMAWFLSSFNVTLPVRIWGMMRSGTNPTLNAVGSIVFLVSITLTAISQLMVFRKGAQEVAVDKNDDRDDLAGVS